MKENFHVDAVQGEALQSINADLSLSRYTYRLQLGPLLACWLLLSLSGIISSHERIEHELEHLLSAPPSTASLRLQ